MSAPCPVGRTCTLSLVVVLAAACAEPADPHGAWPGAVDTLPSGTVIVRNPSSDEWAPESWRIEEDLRIGTLESDGPDQFADIADIAVDELGRLYVSHREPAEIRVFDRDGRFVRAFGREGSGPGEFLVPGELQWGPEGNLWVADRGNGRFAVFDTAGAPVTTHRYAPSMYAYGDRWGDDDLLYTNVAPPGGRFRLIIVRRRLTSDGLEPVDTLPAFGYEMGTSFPVQIQQGERRFTLMAPLPFEQRSTAVLRAGEGWWISDPGAEYRIARTDLEGDTLLIIERPYRPVPVSAADLEEYLDRFEGGDLPRDQVQDVHPPVDDLIPLPDGSLLVLRRSQEGDVLDAFDPAGRFRASLKAPGLNRIDFHAATDSALYGVRRSELDVPLVVRLRLRR